MAKANWLIEYECERCIEDIVANVNNNKRPVFVIDTPGVEGNKFLNLPKNSCHHEWRYTGIDMDKAAVKFTCIWCTKNKGIKINK